MFIFRLTTNATGGSIGRCAIEWKDPWDTASTNKYFTYADISSGGSTPQHKFLNLCLIGGSGTDYRLIPICQAYTGTT